MIGGREFGGKTIVEEPEVLNAVVNYRKTVHRFDDAYNALTWYLSHDGQGIKGSCWTIDRVTYYLYVQKGNKLAGTPRLSVIYTRSEHQINIVALRVLPAK